MIYPVIILDAREAIPVLKDEIKYLPPGIINDFWKVIMIAPWSNEEKVKLINNAMQIIIINVKNNI